MDQIHTLVKYLLSFSKKDWNIKDYPINFKFQKKVENELPKRFKVVDWSARVINWPQMQGQGDTKDEAYKDLEKSFNERKNNGQRIPRPGTGLPIEFATIDGVSKYPELAVDFFLKILDMDYNNVFISDESSLWDFSWDETLDAEFLKIKHTYGVDVSDTGGNFLKIFEKINRTN